MSVDQQDTSFSITPIGVIASDFPDKFGVPRQPGLVPEATAQLHLLEPYNDPLAVRGLEGFSHLWLTFIFHLSPPDWKALVRPPRLGGNARMGVFASRSTHRPNRLGLSLVELVDVSTDKGVTLTLRGADLVHGTPVVDIKPYLPWAEARPEAHTGFAPAAPERIEVAFSSQALDYLALRDDGNSLRRLIEEVLAQDPRPAYRGQSDQRLYGVYLRDVNVRFRTIDTGTGLVLHVDALEPRAALASDSGLPSP
ncbi:tRNA (N6-threonylcarbamoyladenosine(37)-N6)-methyltransferase TrmO [Halomonas cupida]|uniref:tRNA (N6-threonylcarbamoyladenosine(37)-N6)-methyltransferase TrmO n=1 Tax=Halomonas cupida TaxID=44933 RepID=UPI003A94C56E